LGNKVYRVRKNRNRSFIYEITSLFVIRWVDKALPNVIAGFDIVVNPSIRAWSETFCIANIEVMSMEVPIVTFAVGGRSIRTHDASIVKLSHDVFRSR
jgi:glycosyltransferase involved in cell wall biosynthesis